MPLALNGLHVIRGGDRREVPRHPKGEGETEKIFHKQPSAGKLALPRTEVNFFRAAGTPDGDGGEVKARAEAQGPMRGLPGLRASLSLGEKQDDAPNDTPKTNRHADGHDERPELPPALPLVFPGEKLLA